MSLIIRKKGNKNFWHYFGAFEYSASDMVVIFNGNYVLLRSERGRIIGEKDGYIITDVSIYDDTTGGSEETFSNIITFEQRLIALGYPAFYGSEVATGGDWGTIGGSIGDQTDLIDYFNTFAIDGGTP